MAGVAFTELFERGRSGDRSALSAAYELVFWSLRRTASLLLAREHGPQTMQPTGLVGELFVKIHALQCRIVDREHFLRLATNAMKQILTDRGRGRAVRRRLAPEVLAASLRNARTKQATESERAARQVWQRLQAIDAQVADVVWLKATEGMTLGDIALRQGRERWRVKADYDYGIKWMTPQLQGREH